ncbi:MAG: leucine-rich repeat domain-containing protein [Alphaproteobacteria bacterium]|nr:leucine-rich repeat domain-containing protein [Alphaproteobacteria bacterium]
MKNNLFKSAKLTKFFLSIIVISNLFTFQTNATLNEAQKTEITKEFTKYASITISADLEAKIVSGQITNLTPDQKEYMKDHLSALCNSLTWIKELDLQNCMIESLPDEISKLKELRVLNLSNNKISTLPENIVTLNKLNYLNLSNNQFTTLPMNLHTLPQIKFIDLANNKLESFPDENSKKTEITKDYLKYASITIRTGLEAKIISGELINLTQNEKEYIKDHFPALCNSLNWIEKLELYNCNIESLPPEICNLTNLTILDLSNNKLQNLPISFYELGGLQYLYLSSNNIDTLPEEIEGLKSLINLNLSNNKISVFPNNITTLPKLEYLCVENNQLTTLPEEIGNLNTLIQIDLSNNKIKEIPNSVVNLQNLKGLYIEYNNIKILPENFNNLIKIEVINLYHNEIKSLPYNFELLPQLQDLNLGHNKLESLPENIGKLLSLKNLTLEDNNKLRMIPRSLLKLKNSLESLNLLYTNIPFKSKNGMLGREELQRLMTNRVVFSLEKPRHRLK